MLTCDSGVKQHLCKLLLEMTQELARCREPKQVMPGPYEPHVALRTPCSWQETGELLALERLKFRWLCRGGANSALNWGTASLLIAAHR